MIEDGAAGRLPDTPKTLPDRHRAGLIASNRIAVDAAADEARRRGFAPRVLTTSLTGEAREAGRRIAAAAREARVHGRGDGRGDGPPACLIWGGETTVTIRGSGKGGRNQEVALAAAVGLEGLDGVLVASFATDGKEGNTDAAGAFASGATIAAGARSGLDARAALAANDSYAFLAAAGELIVTGPTGTNVNDISLALIG
jgi:glycerate-2-kinase